MPGLVPFSNTCCDPCTEPLSVEVPGPQGPAGTNGTNGTNGINAFCTCNSFTMPAELANVTITCTTSQWMGVGQIVFAGGGGFVGYFQVQSKPDSTHAILKNLEDTPNSAYAVNSPPGTIFPNLTSISPGGVQGPIGPSVAANPGLYIGNGSPEGVQTAEPGSIYTDALTGNKYSKLSGNGNTGWG